MKMEGDCGRLKAVLKWASLLLFFTLHVVALEPGIIHVDSEKGGDYCFFFPSQWMMMHNKDNTPLRLDPQPSTQNLPYSALCCLPSLLGEADSKGTGFSTRIASVREGNCNFFENARLQQINRTQGLLTLGGDAPSLTTNWRSGYNWGHCEEITLPGILLNDGETLYLLFKSLTRDLLYKTGAIYLISMTIVIIGSYWAGSAEKEKKQRFESLHQKEDDFGEITINTNAHFTCTCTSMVTFMLLTLYYFHDYLTHVLNGIFCLYASFSLYHCLTPLVSQIPFGKHAIHVPYFHKGLEIRRLLLAGLCLSVNATWVIFRTDDKWGWVLQDVLGISIGIYILRTVHIPTLQTCVLFLFAHLLSNVLCQFLCSFLTKTGSSGTAVTAVASSELAEIPFLLKVPTLFPALDMDGSSFTALSLGDVVLPGLLVAYCHRFDVQVQSLGIYFLSSSLAYSYGLLVRFIVATLMQSSPSTLPYLMPCILITSLAVAACRKEVIIFWTGVGSADGTPQPSSLRVISYTDMLKDSETQLWQQGQEEQIIDVTLDEEDLNSSGMCREKLPNLNTCQRGD